VERLVQPTDYPSQVGFRPPLEGRRYESRREETSVEPISNAKGW